MVYFTVHFIRRPSPSPLHINNHTRTYATHMQVLPQMKGKFQLGKTSASRTSKIDGSKTKTGDSLDSDNVASDRMEWGILKKIQYQRPKSASVCTGFKQNHTKLKMYLSHQTASGHSSLILSTGATDDPRLRRTALVCEQKLSLEDVIGIHDVARGKVRQSNFRVIQ
jgi:hypothetical protein